MKATGLNQDLLRAAVEEFPADDFSAARSSAVAKLAGVGFPTVGDEDWKYTNLGLAAEISNGWLKTIIANHGAIAEQSNSEQVAMICQEIDAHWIIIQNGIIASDSLADLDGQAGSGVSFSKLEFAEKDDADDDAMSLFNVALLRDGLRITARANATTDKPIGILLADSPSSAVTQTRIVIDAGDNAHLRVVEYNLSVDPGRQFTNSVVQANLASGATVDHVRIQNRADDHVGVNKVTVNLDRDASYNHNSFDLGGALTRNDVIAKIAGKGAAVNLNGLYLATGTQHIDNHTSILHLVGPSTSEEEYRGILAGSSQCVFNGKVIVSPGADGTDSRQSNHNLLLSDRAEIDTKPELEIYADDVKCAHGATVGQLDETALFYLRTRGLGMDEARKMITRAFAAGTLSTLAVTECQDHLAKVLDQRLENLIGDGQ